MTWRFKYSETGDCLTVEEPSGQRIYRTYDNEHRLLTETVYGSSTESPLTPEKTSRFVYDEAGHLRFEVSASGTVVEYRYNEAGLRVSERCYLASAYPLTDLSAETSLTEVQLQTWTALQAPRQLSLIDYAYDWRGQLTTTTHYSAVDETGR